MYTGRYKFRTTIDSYSQNLITELLMYVYLSMDN